MSNNTEDSKLSLLVEKLVHQETARSSIPSPCEFEREIPVLKEKVDNLEGFIEKRENDHNKVNEMYTKLGMGENGIRVSWQGILSTVTVIIMIGGSFIKFSNNTTTISSNLDATKEKLNNYISTSDIHKNNERLQIQKYIDDAILSINRDITRLETSSANSSTTDELGYIKNKLSKLSGDYRNLWMKVNTLTTNQKKLDKKLNNK